MVCRSLADYYIFMYTHYHQKLMKSVGSHGNLQSLWLWWRWWGSGTFCELLSKGYDCTHCHVNLQIVCYGDFCAVLCVRFQLKHSAFVFLMQVMQLWSASDSQRTQFSCYTLEQIYTTLDDLNGPHCFENVPHRVQFIQGVRDYCRWNNNTYRFHFF